MIDHKENVYKKIRNSLFKKPNKEFLIFLFFFALSSIFWLMMTLNETYEQEITVPVQLTGVPKNVVITTGVDSTMRVTVRDKGYTLAAYIYGERIPALKIQFASYANKNSGYGAVPLADIQRQLYQRLMSSSKILTVNPDKIDFYFNYGLSKTVPVSMNGSVVPGRSSSSVIAIGTGSVVETMQLINGLDNAGQLTAVDSSTQGIALIRKLFNRLSDDTETTLRAVNASAGVFLPRLNAENYDLIVVAGDSENYAAAFAQAPRLLKPHAAIVFTDVLAFDSATSAGGVLNPANRDAKSIAMRELLETVESDERFVTALTPTGTGLLVAVKK